MSDEEIKKALECCRRDDYEHCKVCPYRKNKPCQENLIQDCFGFINRQQAEIKRLESLLNQLFKDVDYKLQYIYELEKKLESDQAEAIKEFCREVETIAFNWESPFESNEDKIIKLVALKDINSLLAETVGGEHA